MTELLSKASYFGYNPDTGEYETPDVKDCNLALLLIGGRWFENTGSPVFVGHTLEEVISNINRVGFVWNSRLYKWVLNYPAL